MTCVATKRLIDASARLGPDDRALLSLLINHGLDNVALARLTHAGRAEVAARRELLAERLGAVLELPPATVQDALDELAGTARGHRAAGAPPATDGNHTHPESPAADAPAAAPAATLPAQRPRGAQRAPAPRDTQRAPGPRDARRAGGRRRAGFALMAIAVAVVVALVIALAGGGGSAGKPSAKAGGKTASTAAAKADPSHVSPRSRGALVGLPGGPPGVTGTVAITGPDARPQLAVAVSGLRSAAPGHYELWLYNSIIDSVPLAALGASGRSAVVALPSGYRRYRWLDVSLQPAGSVNHSGESVLRAALPG